MAERTGEPPRRSADADAASRRAAMVRDQLQARGITDPSVLRAMGQVPRERFVPVELQDRAYHDGALAIGHGQTISQPYIVARMTEALELPTWMEAHPGLVPRVLDVGTGSGYQAAVLAAMGARVTSVEQDPELSARAATILTTLGIRVRIVVGDGGDGMPEEAPYAGIVVAAASPDVPPPLLEQLAPDGRLVLPIGPPERQRLVVVSRAAGVVVRRSLDDCVFVPLLGRFGQDGSAPS